jgi:SAM-dependent methyltransferase
VNFDPLHFWREKNQFFGMAGTGQAKAIAHRLRLRRGRVLDLGCGAKASDVVQLSFNSTSVVAVDNSPRAVLTAARGSNARNAAFVVADAFSLPFPDHYFDFIVALGVFAYFIHDLRGASRELHRVIRTGGELMLTNSVFRDKTAVIDAVRAEGFNVVMDREDFCPDASGPVQRRYLLICQAE